jgi:ABC-type multidrug transport system ATPase subunit
MKEDRTILLSTHFMEEADALSDVIIILSNGKIRVNDSPMELKRIYGTGYKLIVNTKDNQFNSQLFELISKYLIHSNIEMESDNQLIIQTNEQSPQLFIQLFDQLDLLKQNNFILNYGLSNTTLGFFFSFSFS